MKKLILVGLIALFNLQNTEAQTYCTATGSANCGSPANAGGNAITKLTVTGANLNNINSLSGCTDGYTDFTALKAKLVVGSNYTGSVSCNSAGFFAGQVAIWVDWNGNGLFTDAGENIFVSSGAADLPFSINVVSGTTVGIKRLRVRSASTAGTLNPCGFQDIGEVEDYTIEVVATTPAPPPVGTKNYCSATGSSTCGVANGSNAITRVVLTGKSININNTSQCNGMGYDDYTGQLADLLVNTAYNGTVLSNAAGFFLGQINIWIDYNNDLDFDDVGENIFTGSTNGVTAVPFTVTPPNGTTVGLKRMRLRSYSSSTPIGPCGLHANGEVEDYSIKIIAPTPMKAKANFTKNDSVICSGEAVTFKNTSVNDDSVRWTFVGGTPSTSKAFAPVIVYNTAGTYDVKLIAYSSAGNDTIITKNDILVSEIPVAAFSIVDSVCVNTNTNIVFTGTSPAGSVVAWSFGANSTPDTAVTASTQTVMWSDTGMRVIQLKISNNGCDSVFIDTIYVKECNGMSPSPIAEFTSSKTTICALDSIIFTNTSTNAVTYDWSFEGGTPSTSVDVSPSVVYSTPGLYDVRLIAINNDKRDTILLEDYITINSNPVSEFTLPEESCIDSVVSIIFTGTASDSATYSWNFGTDATPAMSNTSGNQSATYSTEGLKVVTLQITQNGCTSNVFTDTINIQNCTIVPGDTAISDFTFVINQTKSEVDFTNTSKKATDFIWDFGDGVMSIEKNPIHTYTTQDTFNVCLIAKNLTSSDTTCYSLIIKKPIVIVGLNNTLSNIKLYPNPSKGIINIDGINTEYSLILSNSLGVNVISKSNIKDKIINLEDLPNGYYTMSIIIDNQITFKKIYILK